MFQNSLSCQGQLASVDNFYVMPFILNYCNHITNEIVLSRILLLHPTGIMIGLLYLFYSNVNLISVYAAKLGSYQEILLFPRVEKSYQLGSD